MHKYNNQDHSMFAAMLTVENLHGARHDTWAVNTDFEYLEEQALDQGADETEEAGASLGSEMDDEVLARRA